jgi:large subunit ribosomal protein L28
MARCTLCDKRAVSGNAVSHAQNHTKRKFKPNLQKVNGILMCTQCLRTLDKLNKKEELAHAAREEAKTENQEEKTEE